jgi:tetratricopeptide (TPR) repeat protein
MCSSTWNAAAGDHTIGREIATNRARQKGSRSVDSPEGQTIEGAGRDEDLEAAETLSDLALIAQLKGRFQKAEVMLVRALSIKEGVLGTAHPELVPILKNVAHLRRLRGEFQSAAASYQRCIAILSDSRNPDHSSLRSCTRCLDAVRSDQATLERLHRSVGEATA